MFDGERDPRAAEAYRRFCSREHEFVGEGPFDAWDGGVPLRGIPSVRDGTGSEMVRTALDDFRAFLRGSFRLPEDGGSVLEVRIGPVPGGGGERRAHVVSREGGTIVVAGETEWGVAGGLYHLQRLMRLRRAPAIPAGGLASAPRLDPSLAYPAFKRETTTDLDWPEAYEEGYLLRMARAGYTGFHLNLSTNVFSRSPSVPELDEPDAPRNFETLRNVVAAARRCSLEVFLSYYTVPMDAAHPLFARVPAMRGGRIVNTDALHVLCPSCPETLAYWRDHFRTLFSEAPGLAGVLLIVGCEGFLHCYTAPVLDQGKTSCRACAAADPEEIVARLVGEAARAVRSAAPEARCVVWTYGIDAWTRDQGARLVSLLPPECDVMTNFDTGDHFDIEGREGWYLDYSLRCVGPGTMFAAHEEIARTRGLRLLAKTESGTPRETHGFPTVPANARWGRKYAAVLRGAAGGALFNWKFMGFTGQISEELAGWMSWSGYEDHERLLGLIAERDFGPENVAGVTASWELFDRAMDYWPFTAGTADSFKGPFYIGFAQPLLLAPLKLGGLCDEFWGPWDAGHLTPAQRRPRLVTDLSWVRPIGVDACLRALGKVERLWAEGCAAIPPGERTARHRALAVGILCMVRTAANMVRFFALRDELGREALDDAAYRGGLERLRAIAAEELANAERGLECMTADPMLGFQYTYRYAFTRAMVESKIAHTRRLIERDIPHLWYAHCFSLGRTLEWL